MLILWCAFGFLALIVFAVVKWYYIRNHYFESLHEFPPGPNMLPIFGMGMWLVAAKNNILDVMAEEIYKLGGSIKVMLGFESFVLSVNYDFMEFVMSSNTIIHKSNIYASLKDWLGDGLLLSSGDKWRSRRKAITPAFHFQILEKFIDTFDAASNIMIELLAEKVGESSVDFYPFATTCALDVICETAMGTKVNAQRDTASSYIMAVKDMGRFVLERAMSPISRNRQLYKLMPNYWREKSRLRILHGYTRSVIKSRRTEIMARVDHPSRGEDDSLGSKKKVAFLDLLLQCTIDGKPLSDADISEEVETFMFEGHDTTASAISFCIYSIAQYPEIQARLVAEQKDIFGNDLRQKTSSYKDLQNMKYLEMVLKETLRLYPSVPFFGRKVVQDTAYKGMTLKKGQMISIHVYAMHRNPKFFPDPLKFDPERFSNENFLGKYPYSYIPFSAGARNCIGQKFAMLELKSTVSKVLRNFELFPAFPAHKLMLVPETILKSMNGMCIQFRNRY